MTEQIVQTPFKPFIEAIDGRPVLIQSDENDFVDLEKFLIKPTRVRLNESLCVFESFIEVLKTRFDKEKAAVYVRLHSEKKFNKFYMEGVAADCRTEPEWRDDFKFSWLPDYTKPTDDWLKKDEQPMSQEDFALFLDKHLDNIRCIDPEM